MALEQIPTEKLSAYNHLVEQFPDVDRKGKNNPYTSVNGHMFSFLDKEGSMGLRLSREDREAFIQEHNSRLQEQYGRVMKEYVVIPDDMLMDTETLAGYFQISYDYVSSLKPKPTKRKKKGS